MPKGRVEAAIQLGKARFAEGLLFTHRGLSGPSILQISSYWKPGDPLSIDLAPNAGLGALLHTRKRSTPRQDAITVLAEHLPRRLAADRMCGFEGKSNSGRLADLSDSGLARLGATVNQWQVTPSGTEGYRTAEITLGGVDTTCLSSKTMQARDVPGLFFVGEVVDVTGHLGGYNFQWAWSSGFAAGQNA